MKNNVTILRELIGYSDGPLSENIARYLNTITNSSDYHIIKSEADLNLILNLFKKDRCIISWSNVNIDFESFLNNNNNK